MQVVSLPCIKPMNNVKNMRKLYEKIEGSVVNLTILNVDPNSYGNFLVSINAKLPNELWLIIQRKFESEVWMLSDLLKYLKTEIKGKKQFFSLGHFNAESTLQCVKDKYSSCSFYTDNSQQRKNMHCLFFITTNHPSWKYFVTKKRKEPL